MQPKHSQVTQVAYFNFVDHRPARSHYVVG